MNKTAMLFSAAILGIGTMLSAADSIQILKKADKFDAFVLKTGAGKGQLKAINHYWGNTMVTTESGKVHYITDPFFYNLRHPGEGRYLTHEKLWPLIQAKADQKNQTLFLTQQIPGAPFKKEIKIKLVPGANQLMVTSKITNTTAAAQKMGADNQCIWTSGLKNLVGTVDGKVLNNAKDLTINKFTWANVYVKSHKGSVGVVIVPGNNYTYFSVSTKSNGLNCQWGRNQRIYKPGQTCSQKYIIVWGDGDLTAKLAKLGAQAQKGELDKMF